MDPSLTGGEDRLPCYGDAWCASVRDAALYHSQERSFHLLPNFNTSEVDYPAYIRTIFGAANWWNIFAFTLVLNSMRSIGIATAGMLYYLVLGITTDPEARKRLMAFEFIFDENTIATNSVVNLMAWFMLITGRFTLSMLIEGPTETFLGIRDFDLDEILRSLLPPNKSIFFWWRMLFECFGLLAGWMVFIVIGQLVYGPGDGKKKRRRKRSYASDDWKSIIANDHHLGEVLRVRMEAIVNKIRE